MVYEDIKKVVDSIVQGEKKVIVLDKKENFNKWEGLRCASSDELQSIKDNFDVVIVNNLENISSKELMRVGNKFIILNSSSDKDLIEKSDEILDRITNEQLNDEVKFLDKILGDNDKLLEKKKFSYVILEKEDLISKPSFFFNLALIQNLKKQIAEKEKIIDSQRKDNEILESRIKHLEYWVVDCEKRKEQEVGNLIKNCENQLNDMRLQTEKERENERENITKNYEKEMENLIFDFGRQLEEKERELERLKKEFEIQSTNLQIEQNRLIKIKDEEIKKLTDILHQIKDSVTFKIVSAITNKIPKAKE